ncbi:UDP-4-amino-4,6-dideoxy-N-acetyl-beta-L-altrosamine transaminase [Aquirufa ecclesiirivi]|uniref:UDP-4-amino-4, 6-dideoxy-N-acetyl-beta-L-altrosamine transaminase n=1 Tax=Aquirufa ecclesiirivi TaxID=2715124 RepID=UPI00140ABA66|nr:UDP-4-amino-4,6-dideoxy-N-acetyl-beta-L-altrosamine transaminase [Aquirufa ecclesiirivi]NHC48135.1 UDP-4-amino-4,6-dideoxy-N-acetyl-beta-L-altrosamine transaminase [Aquirufa ecclesiirivi]
MFKPLPYGRQDISEEDIEAVVKVLKSDFLTQGPLVGQFEDAVAQYCGAKYSVAVNSATSALHIACLALGVKEGDWVWTTPITFVASANCAIYCGASVDFVDIDPLTYTISVEKLEEKLLLAKTTGKLPKVVIPVHLCGQSCDMEGIARLSHEYGFKVIEDASHAIGGKYKNLPIGNCQYSDITIFSFHPVKIITSGEGGIALTNNVEYCAHMQRLRSHGITRDPREMSHSPDGPWYYQQIELGFNYRMTDIQAALGLSQLKRLDEFVKRRQEIAKKYNELLFDLDLVIPFQNKETYSSFHLYVVRTNQDKRNSHKELVERLRSNGIMVNLHYIPIYHHPYYQVKGYNPKDFPESEMYYSQAISLPIYFGLKDEEIEYIVEKLKTPINFQTIF